MIKDNVSCETNLITLPAYGEHLGIFGTTGSGKSVLGEQLLNRFDSYFVIDTQNSLNLKGAVKITSPKGLKFKLQAFKKIKYVPKGEYWNKATWNYIFKTLSESSSKRKPKPRIIYIDEIFHIGYGAAFPSQLPILATTARQKKISIWYGGQRPSMLPIPLISECKRLYIFYLKYEEDIKKISKFSRGDGLFSILESLDLNYQFIEVDNATGLFRKMNKIHY